MGQTTPQPQSRDQKHVGRPSALIEQAVEIGSISMGLVPTMFTMTGFSIRHMLQTVLVKHWRHITPF